MPSIIAEASGLLITNLAIVIPSYLVVTSATWLLLWVVLRKSLRQRKIRARVPPPRQLRQEISASLRSTLLFALVSVTVGVLGQHGFYPLADMAGRWGPAWFVVSLGLMVIGQDAYIYWLHRWMHRSRWYRWLHRRHHFSNNPSPFAAYSFDAAEALLTVGPFALLWPAIVPTPWTAYLLFMVHQLVRNALLHCGYELMPARWDGRPLIDWLTTTTHHDLHHRSAGYNFAPWFTWWDRWMGTEHPAYREHFARAAGAETAVARANSA
jgi:sterol desaturase/sphingolipid hydroxylase (fatty acid hydroxylase superfamily)